VNDERYEREVAWIEKHPHLVKFIRKHEHPVTIVWVIWQTVKFFALLPFTLAMGIYYSMRDQ